MTHANPSAFPIAGQPFVQNDDTIWNPYDGHGWLVDPQPGITIRDYFAAKAMAAMIGTANGPVMLGLDGVDPYIAKGAYTMADAMLQARST